MESLSIEQHHTPKQPDQTPKPPELLVITQNMPPAICGVGDYVTLFYSELTRQEKAPEIAFLTRKVDFSEDDLNSLEPELQIARRYRVYRVAPLFWKIRHLPALLKTVRQSGARSIHLHYVPHMYYRGGFGIAVSLFAIILHLLGLSIIVTFHEFYLDWENRPKQAINGLVQRFSFFLLLLATNEAIVTSELRARQLKRWLFWNPALAKRMVVSSVGSNFPISVKPHSTRAEVKIRWGLAEDEIILGFLGGVRWKKQFDWLLAALDAVGAAGLKTRLLMIGSSVDKLPPGHALRQRTSVTFTGFVSAQEASELLGCIDIYLLPLGDGISTRRTALMSGLQYGLPIVATRGNQTSPTLNQHLPVLLVDTDDKAGFATRTRELALSVEKRTELGRKARLYFQSNFNWEQIVQKQLHLFTRPLPAKRARRSKWREILK